MQGDGTSLHQHSVHFLQRKNARQVEVGSTGILCTFFHEKKQRDRAGDEIWINTDVFYIDPKALSLHFFRKKMHDKWRFSPLINGGKQFIGMYFSIRRASEKNRKTTRLFLVFFQVEKAHFGKQLKKKKRLIPCF